MEQENLSAKQFADEIGVSAGTISNIMGGRNNPSLEVMQAVLKRFGTISADWLIQDLGSMYRPAGGAIQRTLFDMAPIEPQKSEQEETPVSPSAQAAQPAPEVKPVAEKKVAKIVLYYTDGTYEER